MFAELRAGCTEKALSHRLNNIRNHGKPVSTPAKAAGTAMKATPMKVTGTPRAPASRVKNMPKTPRSRATELSDKSEFETDPEGLLDSPSVARSSKRATPGSKARHAESEDSIEDGEEDEYVPIKKVKKEPIDEELLKEV
jgi:hypothetical protein